MTHPITFLSRLYNGVLEKSSTLFLLIQSKRSAASAALRFSISSDTFYTLYT